MASAPTPGGAGTTGGNERAESVASTVTVRVRDEVRTLNIGNIPLNERLVVRKATGFPIEAFLAEDAIGVDSLMVLWWLAGRGEGNVFLTLDQVAAAWPVDLTEADLDLSVEDPEDDTPEA